MIAIVDWDALLDGDLGRRWWPASGHGRLRRRDPRRHARARPRPRGPPGEAAVVSACRRPGAGGGGGRDRVRDRDAQRQVAELGQRERSSSSSLDQPPTEARTYRGARQSRTTKPSAAQPRHRGLGVVDLPKDTSVERPRGHARARRAGRRAPRPAPRRAPAPRRCRLLEHVERGVRPLDLVVAGEARGERRASGWRASRAARGVVEHAVVRPGRGSSSTRLGAHVQVAEAVGAAEPLLARGGVEVAAELRARRRARRRGPGRRRAAPARRRRPAPAASTTRPVIHDTCEQATSRVSGPTASPARRRAPAARSRRGARAAASGASTPGCSSSLVSTSSPGCRSSACSTALTPSVVEPVRASSPGARRSARPRARAAGRCARRISSKKSCRCALARAGGAATSRGLDSRAAAPARWCRRSGRRAARGRGTGRAGRPWPPDTRLSRPMIIERSMHADWLSNTYLVADEEGGTGW